MAGGEAARVAARVREILREQGTGDDEPEPRPALWRRLLARVPVRLDPGRRAAFAVGAGVVLAALITGLWLLASRPRAMSVAPTPRDSSPIPGALAPVRT
ncbi:MAG: hypothetical protein J0H43_02685, partial [Actinobacteria bacterium]|nr:hypothetical protein [Actinomycetota bacterium]